MCFQRLHLFRADTCPGKGMKGEEHLLFLEVRQLNILIILVFKCKFFSSVTLLYHCRHYIPLLCIFYIISSKGRFSKVFRLLRLVGGEQRKKVVDTKRTVLIHSEEQKESSL